MARDVTDKTESGFGETAKVIVQAILLALVVRTFFFQPFNIPSGSMKPTLLIGDYLFVTKFSYGYSQHSFPFSFPPFGGRIWGSEPKRGDVVVFKKPSDNETDFIKRVVGLPGDKIQVRDSRLYVNGTIVERKLAEPFVERDGFGNAVPIPHYVETLPGGRVIDTLDMGPNRDLDNTPVFEVPAGHVFMMGDNRDNSTDSRVMWEVGYVPMQNIVGRADVIFFSVREGYAAWQFWYWPWSVRWDRLFTSL